MKSAPEEILNCTRKAKELRKNCEREEEVKIDLRRNSKNL
jgi:hypothetical protein